MSYGGGGFLAGSQTTPESGKKSGPTSLRPVTIAQIINAENAHADAEFVIDGVEAKDITLVACIRNYSKNSTNTIIQIEDGTGQVDARKWDQTNEDEVDEPIDVNTYVRITGTLKLFNGKRHVACSTIKVIEDKNEILFHILETISVHLYHTRGPPGQNNNNNNNTSNNNNNNADRKPLHTTAAATDAYSDLPMNQRKIMHHFQSLDPVPDEGLHLSLLHKHVLPNLSFEKVCEEVENLAESGYVYRTIDDDHIAPSN